MVNRELERERVERYRRRHPERTRAMRKKAQRVYTLRVNFRLTPEEYESKLKEQGGACAICKRMPAVGGKDLAVDHNHTTMENRGLLCDKCNRGIGHFNDDPELLLAAIEYLKTTW